MLEMQEENMERILKESRYRCIEEIKIEYEIKEQLYTIEEICKVHGIAGKHMINGEKRSKNKIQRGNNNRDGIRETEKTAEDRRTEIILYAE